MLSRMPRPGRILMAFLPLPSAVLEEWLFRGRLMEYLTKRMAGHVAITVSATVFALYHLSWFQLLPTFTLGWGLGYLYFRTRNLDAPIIVHLTLCYRTASQVRKPLAQEDLRKIGVGRGRCRNRGRDDGRDLNKHMSPSHLPSQQNRLCPSFEYRSRCSSTHQKGLG